MFQLGLITNDQYNDLSRKLKNSESPAPITFDYAAISQHKYYLLTQADHYVSNADGTFSIIENAQDNWSSLSSNALELQISAIVQKKQDTEGAYIMGLLAYTGALKTYIIDKSASSAVVSAQFANTDINILNGMKFEIPDV